MYFGSAYYPEHLGVEMVEKDAGMMKDAGFNIVRMGEFAWVKMEPEDGSFDFSWLDYTIGVMAKHGIKTLMCTPTAVPPKWLTDKHNDIYQTLENGHTREFGGRRHYCVNNRNYHYYTARIVRQMAEHFKDNQNVIGYQLDNELMAESPYCYCSNCAGDFRTWLRQRYKSIDNLNKNWGTVFWGLCYRTWEEIELPKMNQNPSAVLNMKRFFSDSYIDYAKLQTEIIKSVSPQKIVTHNVCSSGFLYRMDLYKFGEMLDIISVDNYPAAYTLENEIGNHEVIPYDPSVASLAMSMIRGVKKQNFWVTEAQAAGQGGHRMGQIIEPGYVRLWTYQEMAHGGRGFMYFPWRTCPFSLEIFCYGVLDFDSVPRRRYFEIQKTAIEGEKIAKKIGDTFVRSEAAIIRDFNCDWLFEVDVHSSKFKYMRHMFNYYKALFTNNINADVVSPDDDISDYKLVIVPSLLLIDEARRQKLYQFADKGGILIITCLSGLRSNEGTMVRDVLPCMLRELTGIEIEEQDGLAGNEPVGIRMTDDSFKNVSYECSAWCDVLKLINAKAIAVYEKRFYSGHAAITVNSYGKGKVYYVGTIPSEEFLNEFIHKAVEEAKVYRPLTCSLPMVEAVVCEGNGREYLFVLNYSKEAQKVTTKEYYKDIIDGTEGSRFVIGGVDVRVLEKLEA